MKKTNRVLSFVLTVIMTLSLLAVVPTAVSADEPSFVPSENPPAVTNFTDEFTGTALNLNKWTVYHTPYNDNDKYAVADGKLSATTAAYQGLNRFSMCTGSVTWEDYAVEAKFNFTSKSNSEPRKFGVLVRTSEVKADKQEAYSGYFVAIDTYKKTYAKDGVNGCYSDIPVKIRVYRGSVDAVGDQPEIASFDVAGKYLDAKLNGSYTKFGDTEYTLKVLVCGNKLRIYLDGTFVGEVYDDTYTNGNVGIHTFRTSFDLDSFTVRNLTLNEKIDCGLTFNEVVDFTDEFTGTALNLNKWTVYHTPYNDNDKYAVADGKLSATTAAYQGLNRFSMCTGSVTWEDYAVEAKFNFTSKSNSEPRKFGVLVRTSEVKADKQEAYSGYFVAIDTYKKTYAKDGVNGCYSDIPVKIRVYRGSVDAVGDQPEIASFDVAGKYLDAKLNGSYTKFGDTEYTLKVLVCGNKLRIYLDGTFVGEVYDDTYTNGNVGIHTFRTSFDLDSFTVRGLRYYEYGEFGMEIVIPDDGEEDMVFSPGVVMMLFLKKKSEGAGSSATENKTELKKIEDFTDNFEGNKLSDKWTVCYVPTEVNGAVVDSMAVKDGFLTVSATNWNSVKKLKLYTGDPSWTDYAVETTIAPGGTDPRSIGVLVRANNIGAERYAYTGYYVHLNIDKRAGTALNVQIEKCDGSSNGVIVKNQNVGDRSFTKNQEYKLKVLVFGKTMRIYVDGEFVCDYTDSTYKSGYVGINSYMATFKADSFTVRSLTENDLNEFGVKTAGN